MRISSARTRKFVHNFWTRRPLDVLGWVEHGISLHKVLEIPFLKERWKIEIGRILHSSSKGIYRPPDFIVGGSRGLIVVKSGDYVPGDSAFSPKIQSVIMSQSLFKG